MRAHIADLDALGAVSPSGLRAYVVAQGWRHGDSIKGVGSYYEKSGIGEIVVPNSAKIAGYASVVGEVIRILAGVEGRHELQILRDLTFADLDVVRVRFPEADASGSLSIDQGLELVRQSRDMLLAAACAAVEPRRAYHAGKVARAVDYLRDVRLGQSEKGSYILTLLSPVPPNLSVSEQVEMWPELAAEPFARQVTRRLSLSLAAVNVALSKVNSGADISAFEGAVSEGVSANLCEATANLIEYGQGLDVSLTWARTRQGPDPLERHAFIEKDKEILKEVSRLLRDREPRESEVLEGYVEKLSRKQKQPVGQAVLQVSIDGRLTSVSAYFDQDMYARISDAHKERRAISIEGDLVREGQRWQLQRPRHLRVHAESAEI